MPVPNTIHGEPVDPNKLKKAKELRKAMTPAEKVLWTNLRTNRLDGHHFRRQQVIAGFIVDFYCHAASLIIEIDGDIHRHQIPYDRQRTEILQVLGFRLIGFSNQAVLEDLDAVLEEIRANMA